MRERHTLDLEKLSPRTLSHYDGGRVIIEAWKLEKLQAIARAARSASSGDTVKRADMAKLLTALEGVVDTGVAP